MLQILVEAERCTVRGYTEICNMTFGKDHRTYDLLKDDARHFGIAHQSKHNGSDSLLAQPWREGTAPREDRLSHGELVWEDCTSR
jgi:hypothetical protein